MEIIKTRRDIAPPEREPQNPAYLVDGETFANVINQMTGDPFQTALSFARVDSLDYPTHTGWQAVGHPDCDKIVVCGYNRLTCELVWYSPEPDVYLNSDAHMMFASLLAVKTIDLSGFAASYITNARFMFSMCESLRTIIAPRGFLIAPDAQTHDMFYRCVSLVGGAGTRFNENVTDGTYARIDRPPTAPGYFTEAST